MGVRVGLAASWQRAMQRQAFAKRRSARNSRVVFIRLLLDDLVAKRGLQLVPALAGLGLLLLIPAWQSGMLKLADFGAQLEQEVQQQIESEDAALCEKFGFAPGTRAHSGCKLDLAELRHHHEQLLAAYDFP